MQKKLIALAIASAFSASAFAESTVNVYGILDAAVVRASGDGQQSDIVAVSSGLATSRIGVKATEDLDNGMKAVAVAEYKLDPENSDTLSSTRQEMLALAGGFGTVATGYLQTTGLDFGVKYDVVAGSSVSPLQNITGGQGFYIGVAGAAARASRALAYISPNMGGLTFAVNHSTALANSLGNLAVATATPSTKTTATLVSADYAVDALTVGGVYLVTNTTPATGNITEMALGVSYKMDVATIKATYQNQTTNAAVSAKNSVMSIGATVPVAAGVVAVSYAKSTMDAANIDATGYTVAYLQPMSKTTTAYAAYSATSQGTGTRSVSVLGNALSAASLTMGGSTSVIAVGLSKKF